MHQLRLSSKHHFEVGFFVVTLFFTVMTDSLLVHGREKSSHLLSKSSEKVQKRTKGNSSQKKVAAVPMPKKFGLRTCSSSRSECYVISAPGPVQSSGSTYFLTTLTVKVLKSRESRGPAEYTESASLSGRDAKLDLSAGFLEFKSDSNDETVILNLRQGN